LVVTRLLLGEGALPSRFRAAWRPQRGRARWSLRRRWRAFRRPRGSV